MKKYNYILAIDPSGSFHEGKGITGWVFIDAKQNLLASGIIKAKSYNTAEEYYNAHLKLIDKYHKPNGKGLVIVIEDYILYKHKSHNQINSRMETSKLIGILQWYCWYKVIDYKMQLATQVKNRWSDDVLIKTGIFIKKDKTIIHKQSGKLMTSPHVKDAFRHATHFATFKNLSKPNKKPNKQIPKSNYKNMR